MYRTVEEVYRNAPTKFSVKLGVKINVHTKVQQLMDTIIVELNFVCGKKNVENINLVHIISNNHLNFYLEKYIRFYRYKFGNSEIIA